MKDGALLIHIPNLLWGRIKQNLLSGQTLKKDYYREEISKLGHKLPTIQEINMMYFQKMKDNIKS